MTIYRKYNFKEGDKIESSNLIFIKDICMRRRPGGSTTRIILAKCFCNNLFETSLSQTINGQTKSCGCYKQRKAKETPFKHGLIHDPIYWTWSSMKDRTYNTNNGAYKNYGGRGIIVFPPWQVDFQLFYDYVSALPHFKEKGYSLDRIDNDGNYEPCNLRWTTDHFQAVNSRKRKCNTSGFVGVSKKGNKWISYIYVYNKKIHLGTFKSITKAVDARNEYIRSKNLIEYPIQEIILCQ